MNGEATPLRMDAEEAAGARVRIQLDWQTFVYLVAAVLGALAVIAVFSGTATMLTRVGVGLIIALALDPITKAVHRRLGVGRGLAAGIVGLAVLGLAAVFIGVLAPLAVEEAGQFSEQLPAALDELEQLPLVGGLLRDNEIADRAQEWVRDLPDQFTDERIAEEADRLVSGIASVMIVAVVAIALLIDGENLLARLRRLLSPQRRAQADYVGDVVYRTLGRYFGGSVAVAVLMGLYVLTMGLLLGVPLAPLAAVWAMLTSLIPQVGGFLGGSFFVLMAMTEGVTTALIAAVVFVVYMNLENHVIQPAIVGRSVDLAAPTTMVAAFVGAAIAGVPGALIATPLVGAAKAIYLETRGMAQPEPERREGSRIRRLLDRRRS
ncbi:MAG TPA: AI-2E family transporter [Ilumatobacteraceae bacterium]|nr:AI-2E family transporter [Ilumatobacteraceae bacterium]